MKRLLQLTSGVNAYTLAFDDASLDEIRSLYEAGVHEFLDAPRSSGLLKGGTYVEARWHEGSHKFFACSYDSAPLLWISPNDLKTHEVFDRFFRSLDIVDDVKELVNCDKDVIVYNGFFVVGDHLSDAKWHVDYFEGANALTLIAPLFDLAATHGNLLYQDAESAIQKYLYSRGEAIVLGDRFLHSTEPYPASLSQRVLVSLTFGTDKLDFWPVLKETAGRQSEFLVLPCGHPRKTCHCLRDFEAHRAAEQSGWITAAIRAPSGMRVIVSPHIRSRELEGETVLIDASGRRCAALDAIGARMWHLIEQHGLLDRVRTTMLAEYQVEPGQLDADILAFVRSLVDAGMLLLEPSTVNRN